MMASRTRADRSRENCPFSSWRTATHLCNHTRTVNKILGESELGGGTCLEHVSTKAGEEPRKVKAGCCVANGFLWMLQQCLQEPHHYLLDHAESTTIATTTTTRTTITTQNGWAAKRYRLIQIRFWYVLAQLQPGFTMSQSARSSQMHDTWSALWGFWEVERHTQDHVGVTDLSDEGEQHLQQFFHRVMHL